MAATTKEPSLIDGLGALKNAFNEEDSSLTIAGFLVGKVGHKIEMATSTTNVADDTLTYTYKDGSTTLYAIRVIYTDATYETLISAERIS